MLQCVAVCCRVLQCVAVCCSVLQCLAVCSVLQCDAADDSNGVDVKCVVVCSSMVQYIAVCCSVLQYVAVCCSALQCVAVCCSVLQCVAADDSRGVNIGNIKLVFNYCRVLLYIYRHVRMLAVLQCVAVS